MLVEGALLHVIKQVETGGMSQAEATDSVATYKRRLKE